MLVIKSVQYNLLEGGEITLHRVCVRLCWPKLNKTHCVVSN